MNLPQTCLKQFLMFSHLFFSSLQFHNRHITAQKNITTKPDGILHPNGRKFTKFTQHHVNEGGGGGNEDEARYNLATRVMSNGVEVIVADGKSTLPGANFFRILTNSKNYNRPLTLAPSTLNNVMMLMTLGGKNPKVKVTEKISLKNI